MEGITGRDRGCAGGGEKEEKSTEMGEVEAADVEEGMDVRDVAPPVIAVEEEEGTEEEKKEEESDEDAGTEEEGGEEDSSEAVEEVTAPPPPCTGPPFPCPSPPICPPAPSYLDVPTYCSLIAVGPMIIPSTN